MASRSAPVQPGGPPLVCRRDAPAGGHPAARSCRADRFFTRDEVHRILGVLEELPVSKAMFLLALNGGLGATDLSAMPLGALDLDNALLDYDRVKTGVARTVTLWPRS